MSFDLELRVDDAEGRTIRYCHSEPHDREEPNMELSALVAAMAHAINAVREFMPINDTARIIHDFTSELRDTDND